MRVGSVVLRVTDLPCQLRFWTVALDYVPHELPKADWVALRSRVGDGPTVSLSVKPSQVRPRPRMHRDPFSEDSAGDVERLLALGVTRPEERNRPADADYVILANPEGNRFCVVDFRSTPPAPAAEKGES